MAGYRYAAVGLVFLVQLVLQTNCVAPSDFDITCRTHLNYRLLHDWIPYANDTSSGTWKVLIDQYGYQNLITGHFELPAGVWSIRDVDGDGKIFSHGVGGTSLYQIKVSDSYRNPNSNNWFFTQAVDYIDTVELIVNATVRFTACIQHCTAEPPCTNDYVILHRYDTNTLSENERTNTANYQPYFNNSESSSCLNGNNNIISRFHRPVNFNDTYLGLQDIGSIGNIIQIFMYYEVCPRKVEGLATYPEVPHPGRLPGASTRTTRLASCAEHSHNTTSLETYAYQDGQCKQNVTCVCDMGYEQQQQNPQQCIACAANTYRSTLNSSCVECPGNSSTSTMTASEKCICTAGHYRVTGSEGVGVGCTGHRILKGIDGADGKTSLHESGGTEVPYPGILSGASTQTIWLANCAEHSHSSTVTSLETYTYQDGLSPPLPDNARSREGSVIRATAIQGRPNPSCPECTTGKCPYMGEQSNKCNGMCGLGCHCWPMVCGDCCIQQGCLDHDNYCVRDGYLSYNCTFGLLRFFDCSGYSLKNSRQRQFPIMMFFSFFVCYYEWLFLMILQKKLSRPCVLLCVMFILTLSVLFVVFSLKSG